MEQAENDGEEIELADTPGIESTNQAGQVEHVRNILEDRANATILGDDGNEYLPCLQDHYDTRSEPQTVVRKIWNAFDHSVVQKIGRRPAMFRHDLQSALYEYQLWSGLPEPTNHPKHVYVVTRPHIPFEVSRFHWSMYSQGCFYHLSARLPHNPTDQSDLSGCERKAPRVQLVLKVEDMSTIEFGHHIRATAEAARKPFVAYEVGSTQYDPEQIRALAAWIIASMRSYDLLLANFQVFTMSLVERTVMTRRDAAAFVGTKTQLVDWDLRNRDDEDVDPKLRYPYDLEHG
ncbi:hypothetical protein MMC34_007185 [Xylographa carneopallida]|nr:hypothetical protein [Xylographa carneopallida]